MKTRQNLPLWGLPALAVALLAAGCTGDPDVDMDELGGQLDEDGRALIEEFETNNPSGGEVTSTSPGADGSTDDVRILSPAADVDQHLTRVHLERGGCVDPGEATGRGRGLAQTEAAFVERAGTLADVAGPPARESSGVYAAGSIGPEDRRPANGLPRL
jgi:hypothetical protein